MSKLLNKVSNAWYLATEAFLSLLALAAITGVIYIACNTEGFFNVVENFNKLFS